MPGPSPKDLAIRQRTNKSATRALLPAETAPIKRTPRLPANPAGSWEKLTCAWWHEVWRSPQHTEFLRSDLGSLFRLAVLVDGFWKEGKLEVATEIRLLEREFGLTPLSRRRLEWRIAQTEEALDIHEHNRAKRAIILDPIDPDPREVLG